MFSLQLLNYDCFSNLEPGEYQLSVSSVPMNDASSSRIKLIQIETVNVGGEILLGLCIFFHLLIYKINT